MRSVGIRPLVLGFAACACIAAMWFYFSGGEALPSATELADAALHAPTPVEQSIAAAQLVRGGPDSAAHLRTVLRENADPDVQVVCVDGLAELWDYESVDTLLALTASESPAVRGRAAQAVMRMTGRQRPYRAEAAEQERRLLVEHMRADWREIQSASAADRDELIRRLRESHEKKP